MNARQGVGAQGSDAGGAGGASPSGSVRGYGMGRAVAPQAYPAQGQPYGQRYIPQSAVYGAQAPSAYPPPAYVVPATSVAQQARPPRKRRALVIAGVIAIICAVAAVALVLFLGGPAKGARSGSVGQLEGKTHEEIQAELDRIVEEGMFNISIASTVEMADGTSLADLRIENVPGNRYLMRVVITDDGSGRTLYATDLIEPNHHIQSDTLDVDLDAGVYECTATFIAYDQQTEGEVGQAAAKMTIRVAG